MYRRPASVPRAPNPRSTAVAPSGEDGQPGMAWFRVKVIAPPMRVLITVSMAMLVMQMFEKLFMTGIALYVKVFNRKPGKVYKWEPLVQDEESSDAVFPVVLVQIPMYNEKEVYHLSIEAACKLSWPKHRLIVQVLDDSDEAIKELVRAECAKWAKKGVDIRYEVRSDRKGYKAGALKEGMKHNYVRRCEFVAIFDSDFQPDADFLVRIVPFLVYNPEISLVQSRWKFVNASKCLMTRMQEMSLNYHFTVEQQAGSSAFAFFGFNGTAGVWRITALNDSGGWNTRTTVEDMDLAVRACLKGWKFVYVGDVKVKSELPSNFAAYRFQQHRWSCGPANLFRKMAIEIIQNKKVSLLKRLHIIYNFFFLGKIVAHTLSLTFFCGLIPLSVLVPEISIPAWAMVYVPCLITIAKAIETPRSFHLVVIWVLFENAMSLHRFKAIITGLLEAKRANEWVVTQKRGDDHEVKAPRCANEDVESSLLVIDAPMRKPLRNIGKSPLTCEGSTWGDRVGAVLLSCGLYDVLVAKKRYFVYIFLQGIAFLVVGFDYVGVPAERSE
ncbi:unnamed protein product [Spirodela intermedia]|uniref:glucomannan 4-beta-mannosyltransferase n=1 Tax=Spirodela intermedia TaxID=51605 RepID=A0A7I8J527_SPIIN|nr:unnamed protein product [Spirodela intermedia]CAA6665201.1 unnamed protein product [Spirodela intermedia]